MNQTQIKYIKQRAESIYTKHRNNLSDQFTQKAVTLTSAEVVEALRAGNFAIVDHAENIRSTAYNIREFIVFPTECHRIVDDKGLVKPLTELKIKYEQLMDELILGDNEQALALLKAFENIG